MTTATIIIIICTIAYIIFASLFAFKTIKNYKKSKKYLKEIEKISLCYENLLCTQDIKKDANDYLRSLYILFTADEAFMRYLGYIDGIEKMNKRIESNLISVESMLKRLNNNL